MNILTKENLKVSLCGMTVLCFPIFLYLIIKKDPTVGYREDGEPIQLGIYIISGLFWISIFLIWKYYSNLKEEREKVDSLVNQNNELEAELKVFRKQELENTFDENSESKDADKYIDKNDLPSSLIKINDSLKGRGSKVLELLDAKAEVLNLMGRENEAITIYKEIISIDENYANAYIALYNLYKNKEFIKNKRYSKEIIHLLKKLEEIDSSAMPFFVLGNELRDAGLIKEAKIYYDKENNIKKRQETN